MSKLPTPLRKGIKEVKVPPPLAGGGGVILFVIFLETQCLSQEM
jgi:hypothetical protein